MTIRRRRTIIDEVEDSIDSISHTGFPTQPTEPLFPNTDTGTSEIFPETSDEEALTRHAFSGTRTNKPTIGRTFPDLLIEIKNDYRLMAVMLIIVSILIFVIFDDIEPIIYPLLTAILLNSIYFGVHPLVNVLKGFRKKR